MTGAATLLVEAGERAQRRGPTLLAAPAARRLEEALSSGGRRAAARGQLCHLPLAEPGDDLEALTGAIAGSGAELAVIHLAGSLWVPALDLDDLESSGGCLLVSLPGDRSLAALAVHDLARRGLPARVVTRPPSAIGARRALAGARPGGRFSELAARTARRLLGLGPAAGLASGRGERAQALPALLGAGVMLILCAWRSPRSAGRSRARRGSSAPPTWRRCPPRAACATTSPRLLAPGAASRRLARTRAISPGSSTWAGRGSPAADAATPQRRGPRRACGSRFPTAPRRRPCGQGRRSSARSTPARLPGGERIAPARQPIRVVASAVAEATRPNAPGPGCPPGRGRRILGPPRLPQRGGDAPRRCGRLRPHGGRGAPRKGSTWSSSPVSLGRRAGRALRAAPRPALGGAAGPLAAPLCDRARPRAVRRPTAGSARTPGASVFVRRYRWEPWHFGFVAGPLPCSPAGDGARAAGRAGGSAACPPSSRRTTGTP